ncbi:MAG: hypothetical protein ABL890_02145 [Candidatus Peribacteraceae bacterium]
MNSRQAKLLSAIIDQFIQTALPVGSHHILEGGLFPVSGATIRNEMRALGEEGLIEQPHTSAGRIPTVKGYRMYVQDFMNPSVHEKAVRKRFDSLREQYFQHKDRERVYEAVALLSNMVPNVSFATVPHRGRVIYLGLSNALKLPEFQGSPDFVSGIVEVLEKKLVELLAKVTLTDKVQFYIGESHLCKEFESCSMLVTKYSVRGEPGAIGILGPVRMDYAYNTVALDMIASLVRD